MMIGLYRISVDEDLPSTYQCSVMNYGGSVGVSKELKVNAILSSYSDGKRNKDCRFVAARVYYSITMNSLSSTTVVMDNCAFVSARVYYHGTMNSLSNTTIVLAWLLEEE